MAQVIVRNLPAAVVETFRSRAKRRGRSLEQELRDTLARSAMLTPEEKVAASRQLRAATVGAVSPLDSTAVIRKARDTR